MLAERAPVSDHVHIPMSSFETLLTPENIRIYADPASWQRAQSYVSPSVIHNLVEYEDRITAIVSGSEDYEVEFGVLPNGDLEYNCSCPAGASIGFCKHCIAVGLYWYRNLTGKNSDQKQDRGISGDDVRTYLLSLGKEQLVELLMDRWRFDREFAINLELRAGGGGEDITLEELLGIEDLNGEYYFDYYGSRELAADLRRRLRKLRRDILPVNPDALVQLTARLAGFLNGRWRMFEGYEEELDIVQHEALQLCADAVRASEPETKGLTDVICEIAGSDEENDFLPGPPFFSRIGPRITGRIEKELLRRQKRGEPDVIYETVLEQIESAEKAGSFEEDRSDSGLSGTISAPYRKLAGLEEEFQRWPTREGLRDQLLESYRALGDHEGRLRVARLAFEHTPSRRLYEELRDAAEVCGKQQEVAEELLDFARLLPENIETGAIDPYDRSTNLGNPQTFLYRVMLDNGMITEAWDLAMSEGCDDEGMWEALAEARSDTNLDDALGVWQELIENRIDRKNRKEYGKAVRALLHMRTELRKNGRGDEYDDYLAALGEVHAKKLIFWELLAEADT